MSSSSCSRTDGHRRRGRRRGVGGRRARPRDDGEPFDLGGTEFHARRSIGIACSRGTRDDAPALIRNADAAMYRARTVGPAAFVLLRRRGGRPGEALLHHAAAAGVARAAMGPALPADRGPGDGRVIGAEASIRWQDAERRARAAGGVHPGRRRARAHRSDRRLGARRGGRQTRRGDARASSSNLGSTSRRGSCVAAPGRAILGSSAAGDLDPTRITAEITESTAMADPDRTQAILAELPPGACAWRWMTSGPDTPRSRG